MQLLKNLGQIAICPPEAKLLSEAMALWNTEHGSTADEKLLLLASSMEAAFSALAIAGAFEFYITPGDETKAREWMNSLQATGEEA